MVFVKIMNRIDVLHSVCCVEAEVFFTQLDVLICVGFGLWPGSYFTN